MIVPTQGGVQGRGWLAQARTTAPDQGRHASVK